ncbi:MAG: FAD-binding oxidoreductase [Chloroherpetonaceae bacterium]|nr:FAD-binding oxidoreductase [Chloroherpetonaceae bacterium]
MIFKTESTEIQSYLEDSSAIYDGYAAGVYFPENENDLVEITKNCVNRAKSREKVRITLSGNGTGTTGGRIPYGDYVIATDKLNKIISIEKHPDGSGSARVQTGVLLYDFQAEVERQGMIYTPDPTERYCFIGGTIANNSSGARTFKYGATRPYVLQLKCVLPTGELLTIERGKVFSDERGVMSFETDNGRQIVCQVPHYEMPKTTKHVAGYFVEKRTDLIDLIIGSEGTLGIIVEAQLKLLPKPDNLFSGLIYFDSDQHLLGFVGQVVEESRKIDGEKKVDARAVEYFDRNALNFLRKKYPQIPEKAEGAVFFEQETNSSNENSLLENWFSLMQIHEAMIDESWIAMSPDEQQKIRDFRHALPVLVNEWYAKYRQRKISTDMAVPYANFSKLMNAYKTGCENQGFDYILFGHIGDAHLHLNILPKNQEEALKAKELYKTLIKLTLELKGTISAEHGVGKLKSEFLVDMYGEEGIKEMVALKKAFDPYLIMNIGNLIPERFYSLG